MHDVQSVRLSDVEKDFIINEQDSKFSEYVHRCISKDLSPETKKKRMLSTFMEEVVLLGLSAILLVFSFDQNLLGFLILFLLGVFLQIYSILNIIIKARELKKDVCRR